MIYYRLLAIINLLFTTLIVRIVLGELNILEDTSPKTFLIFFTVISVLMFIMMIMTKKDKTIIYKKEKITITNNDRMFIKLIRKSDYKVNKKLIKMIENKGRGFSKLISFTITLALFIKILQIANVKINLSQNQKLIILLLIASIMFFVGLTVLLDTKAIQYNIILPYYKNLILLETINELDENDEFNYIKFLRKYKDIGFDKNDINELKEEIKKESDRVSLLIDIDKNTDVLK